MSRKKPKEHVKAVRDLFFGFDTAKNCWWCETPLSPDDKQPIHKECEFASTSGHLVQCCTCYPPPDGRGQWANDREMALEAWSRRRMLNE